MAKADQVKKGFPFLNPVTPVSKMGTSHLYLRIFFFNTRHTAQGRNTARGVPAFSDRLFGKCKPRKLPLKQSSAACIISHSTNALPKARQASSTASSGVSVQITLSQTRFTPALSQSLSQVRIHSPSPQP